MGESNNVVHTLESATGESFHPQPPTSVGLEMARLVNGLRRKCEGWPDPLSEGPFPQGTEHAKRGMTLNCHKQQSCWKPPVTAHGGQGRCQAERRGCSEPPWAERRGRNPPAASHSPCETRIVWAGWMLPFPTTSTYKHSFSSAEHN